MEQIVLDDASMVLFAPCLREELNISAEHNIYQVRRAVPRHKPRSLLSVVATGAARRGSRLHRLVLQQIKLRDALVSSLQFSKSGGSRGVDDSSFAWIDGRVLQPKFNPRLHDEADRGKPGRSEFRRRRRLSRV